MNTSVGVMTDAPKHTEETLSDEIHDLEQRIEDIRSRKMKAKSTHEKNLNSISETRKALASMEERALNNNYEQLLTQESDLTARLTGLQNRLMQLTK